MNTIVAKSAVVRSIEDDCNTVFLHEARGLMSEMDWKILSYSGEDETGSSMMWENPKSRFSKNLYHFLALGGFLPSIVTDALAKGKLYSYSENTYPWVSSLNIPDYATPGLDLYSAVIIYRRLNIKDKEVVETLKKKYQVTFLSLNDLYCHKVAETDVTEDQLVAYLQNVGGKLIEGWWQIKFKRYTILEVKFDKDKGSWIYREGSQELVLRNFHSVSGLVPTSKHTIMLVVLNFLLTSKNEEDLRGRRAFMSNVFIDPIFVGYSHKLLDKFNSNKLGAIRLGCGRNWMPALVKDNDLVTAAKAYEEKGYSTFLHKGAKYVVIEAECAGFARSEGKTFVAWHADKQAKLTGRNLFSVPTAGEYIDDEED